MSAVDGDGVDLNNVTVRNWKGTAADGAQRGPIKVVCASGAPCTEVTIEDFAMWTESGDEQTYRCENAFGEGFCLQEGDGSSGYTTTQTASTAPSGYPAPRMPNDLDSAFGTDSEIPIPTIPTSFYPGATPYSALAGAAASAGSSTPAVSDRARATLAATGSVSLSLSSTADPTRVVSDVTSSIPPLPSSPSSLDGDSQPLTEPHGHSHHKHRCRAH